MYLIAEFNISAIPIKLNAEIITTTIISKESNAILCSSCLSNERNCSNRDESK